MKMIPSAGEKNLTAGQGIAFSKLQDRCEKKSVKIYEKTENIA